MNSCRCETNLLLIFIAVSFWALFPVRSPAGENEGAWGEAENGLQMSIYPAHELSEPLAPFQFRVEIRNVGDKDLLLLLGEMLANGKKQNPTAMTVLFTTPQGENLECGVPGDGMVFGWVGPFIVPVPRGASYSLPLDLKNWTANWKWCYPPPMAAAIPLPITAGKYTFRARYSVSAKDGKVWPGTPPLRSRQLPDQIFWGGFILEPKWIGTVTSNQVELQVPAQRSAK